MKRSGFLFAVFMLMAAVAFSGCGGGGGDDDNNTNPGKIGVALTEAAEFNGEDVMCAIFDSNAVDDEGGPAGNLLGSGIIVNVSDGSGSCVILEEDESEKIFDPGVYYLMAGIDLEMEEHTSELQSRPHLVCRLLLEKKKNLPSNYI